MNHRMTLAAAVAVILASISEFAIISGGAWLATAIGAVAVVALAGTLTRLAATPAAIGATLLALAASVPLFLAPSPYLKAAGVVLVAICAASASRLRLLPAVATAVSYLAALLLYLNAMLAGPQSLIRLIPTITSMRQLATLARHAMSLAKLPPPVQSTHGIQLLAAASIGLAAIVVDVLAVRLHRPAIAGLPLLVLFMAPITTAAKVGGISGAFVFFLAALGYLGLLSSDGRDRLRGWGRVVTVWHYAGEDDRLGGAEVGALAATGRRIGLAAVCMAIVVPVLLPSLHLHRIFPGSGGGSGSHTRGVELPNPVVQLQGLLSKGTDTPVLTYHTNSVDPSAQYLPVYVVNYDSDSTSWDLIRPDSSTPVRGSDLPAPPGVTAATPEILTRTTITLGAVSGYSSPIFFLPVPYWPLRLQIPGSWSEADQTLMIFSGQGNRQGLNYTVTSEEQNPTPDQLEAPQQLPTAIKTSYLKFDSGLTSKLRAIAQRITRGKDNAYAKAIALENWFLSGQFTYSLQSRIPDTPAGLLSFLTTSKHGFCQQFAFAYAVLARLVGIPSQIAVGYTAGHERPDGSWVVTTGDAHAWPELYFSGVGWLRFEPTPGGATGQGTAVQPGYVTAATTGPSSGGQRPGGGPSPGPTASVSGGIKPPHVQGAQVGDTGVAPLSPIGQPVSRTPFIIAALVVLLLAAVAPAATRLTVRGRRWRGAAGDTGLADAAWQELCDDLEDFGLPGRPSESPRTLARRVCAAADFDDEARQAVRRITTAVEQARYAQTPALAGPLRSDVTVVRRGLASDCSLATRWQARLLPASTLRPMRSAIRQALGLVTGWMPSAQENASA